MLRGLMERATSDPERERKCPVSVPGREDAVTGRRKTHAPARPSLPCFLVGRVLAAVPAELLVLDPPGLLLLVLGGRVVAPLAVDAFQRDDISHGVALRFCDVYALLCRACDRD